MSRGPHNIVIGGMGVRVKRADEEVERSMIVNHIFCKCPKDFWRVLYSCCVKIRLSPDPVAHSAIIDSFVDSLEHTRKWKGVK